MRSWRLSTNINMSKKGGPSGLGGIQAAQYEEDDEYLALFRLPKVDRRLKTGREILLHPIAPVTDENPIEINIPSGPKEDYTLLTHTRWSGYMSIVRADGTALQANDDVAPINNSPNSCIKSTTLEINNTQVNDMSSATYAHRDFLEKKLSFSRAAKDTHLRASGWIEDSPGMMDSITANAGYVTRKNIYALSNKVYFNTTVPLDVMQCPRAIFGGIPMKIVFNRHNTYFSLMCKSSDKDKYKIIFGDVRLHIFRVTVDPSIVLRHQQMLKRTPANFPIVQVKIKTFSVGQGLTSFNIANIFRGLLPNTLYLGLLTGKAFSGDVTKNPFKFENHDLNLICLRVNGEQVPNAQAFRPNWTTGEYVREYVNFQHCVGVDANYLDNGITLGNYKDETCLHAFDLNPDQCNGFHSHATQEGNIDVDIELGTPTAEPLTVLVYAVFNSAITIDHDYNVSIGAIT